MTPLQKEYKFYLDHYDDLVKLYDGKTLLIVGEKVVGVYDDEFSAYSAGKDTYGLGHFMMQACSHSEKGYQATYHSRIR